jgi:hypothetical protein
MKTSKLAPFVVLAFLIFTNCTPVRIYSNQELTEKSGLKYYAVKPFLHVEREPETERIVKAVVVYLPDLSNPQYIVIHDGLGSKKVNLDFTDGTIKSFGYSSVGKIGESVDALAAMIAKSTDALIDLKGVQPVKAQMNSVELYEIVFGPEKTTLRKVEIGK